MPSDLLAPPTHYSVASFLCAYDKVIHKVLLRTFNGGSAGQPEDVSTRAQSLINSITAFAIKTQIMRKKFLCSCATRSAQHVAVESYNRFLSEARQEEGTLAGLLLITDFSFDLVQQKISIRSWTFVFH